MSAIWLYGALLAVIVALYVVGRRRAAALHARELRESREAGLAEPPSLHPVVDPTRCIGSGACVQACPEKALGLVGGRAVLTNAAACIGHGACAAACPLEAIRLVFGTEKRGIDIPRLTPQFESNVPGIFIAGELGGMGLIRKAAEQGRQAMDAIRGRPRNGFDLDVVIVGSGPAGLSAGLAALEHRLRYRIVEQEDSLGGTVFHYPRHKITMTAPVRLALVGRVRLGEIRKEDLLELWRGIVERTGLLISFGERMEGIEPDGDGFVVQTTRGRWRTRSVLLAMGRRGTPRKLDVPGEDSAKVVYRLADPAEYAGQRVLVVGGGDSALEAAIALAEQAGTEVALSYRGEAFNRVKARNRERVHAMDAEGRLRVLTGSVVTSIEPGTVSLRCGEAALRIPNDAVVVCAGGLPPMPLLQKAGIRFETKFGTG